VGAAFIGEKAKTSSGFPDEVFGKSVNRALQLRVPSSGGPCHEHGKPRAFSAAVINRVDDWVKHLTPLYSEMGIVVNLRSRKS